MNMNGRLMRGALVWAIPLFPLMALHAGCGKDRSADENSDGDSHVGGAKSIQEPDPDEFKPGVDGGYAVGDEVEEGQEVEVRDDDEDEDDEPVGGAAGSEGGVETKGCSVASGLLRDFKRGDQDGGHPDFEMFWGSGELGLVSSTLGPDHKPMLADGARETITSEASFGTWYRTTKGTNRAFVVFLSLEEKAGMLTFGSDAFFPLDEMAFGNQGMPHNYGFTTEFHTRFVYRGGETLVIRGDDDIWAYVAEQLVIDLGGPHAALQAKITLDDLADELALEVGQEYPLDLFHAERRSVNSTFYLETNIAFSDCNVFYP